MYEDYMQKQLVRDPKLLIKKKRAEQDDEFTGFDAAKDSDDDTEDEKERAGSCETDASSNDFDFGDEDAMAPTSIIKAPVVKSAKAEMFFNKDIFNDVDLEESDEDDIKPQAKKQKPSS